MQEITAASQEQSAGVAQINIAMSQLNQITQQNASASEELAATAEEMTSQASQLMDLISYFKVNQGDSGSRSTKLASNSQKIQKKNKIPQVHTETENGQFVQF